ncbi:MAG: helicase [Wenzhouxiangellaceae bacterium]|nr:MAG: helicase [Wenzhouxiangellaceae bacterium]
MKRPDVEAILRPLKPFQRRTVDHAFERLFLAKDSTFRFLVADEVGLGKTLVARGVIARAIEHHWDNVGRIDIVYICSNQSIARSNLPKLQVTGEQERSFALATRLTMLATELAPREGERSFGDSKVNFISFTPGTSFQMGHSGGMAKERRVLFHLLDGLIEPRLGLMNLMQGGVQRTQWWRTTLNENPLPLDEGIYWAFRKRFRANARLRREIDEAIEWWFHRKRERYPREATTTRNRLLGELRRMLADLCVQALEPDLIILDEFQRFKGLLEARDDHRDPAAEIAQALFNATTPEGHAPRTLLLSATPYKLYTADAEIEHEDHYRDFIDTTRFLFAGEERRVQAMQSQLARYGSQLKRAAQGIAHDVERARNDVQTTLKSVMARTERIAASMNRDAMVSEPTLSVALEPADVRQYMASDALFRAVGDQDPMAFWKSAPYLAHFMHGYRFNQRLADTKSLSPEKIALVLKQHAKAFLKAEDIDKWRSIDPANAKLRELTSDFLSRGLWKLLWVPPTVNYWPLSGAFEGQEQMTKTLLFSAWNVVPDVISGVLSYEAERCMLGGSMDSYHDPDRQQRGLLRLTQTAEGGRSRHRLLLLLLPCLTLADKAHPLQAPEAVDRRQWVRERVDELLADPALPDPLEGPVDERWEWAILVLLDPGMRSHLECWRDADIKEISKPNPEVLPGYVDDLLNVDPATLGRRPEDLAALVADIALGSPAVLAARMLESAGQDGEYRRWYAAQLADAFWKLFNRPAVIRLLLQLSEETGTQAREEGAYWQRVLHYCIDGNLQAVLDENWHLIWEQHAWSEKESVESICETCIKQIAESVEPRASRVHAHFFKPAGSRVEQSEVRLRTVLALRFGHSKSEEGMLGQDAVRAAFNSPFRPFVLSSTSIGQEGLDFHPWCHRLVHWNLPGNPVDMEQREGRVHRYKGHAVRRNVAEGFSSPALAEWRPGRNLWDIMFDLANSNAREQGLSDMIPHWIAHGSYSVERRVPLLPYTQEVQAFARLKRQLAAYRVVFGQPRQQEMLGLLDRAEISAEDLNNWSIDLSP